MSYEIEHVQDEIRVINPETHPFSFSMLEHIASHLKKMTIRDAADALEELGVSFAGLKKQCHSDVDQFAGTYLYVQTCLSPTPAMHKYVKDRWNLSEAVAREVTEKLPAFQTVPEEVLESITLLRRAINASKDAESLITAVRARDTHLAPVYKKVRSRAVDPVVGMKVKLMHDSHLWTTK